MMKALKNLHNKGDLLAVEIRDYYCDFNYIDKNPQVKKSPSPCFNTMQNAILGLLKMQL